VLFGCSAPLVSTLAGSGSALSIAGLLYAGATLALLTVRLVRGSRAETPIRREDWPALGALTLLGGVVGPVALVLGLARLPAATSSLLLNLEAVFTLAIAVLLGREHLGRSGLVSALLTIAGAVVLSQGTLSGANALGGALIALATLAWGIDNNLSQRLSLRDPIQIATAKAAGGFTADAGSGPGAGTSLSAGDGDPGAAGHRRPWLRHFDLARSAGPTRSGNRP
jgi:drug/metabolite transporter (DMT)-like permease